MLGMFVAEEDSPNLDIIDTSHYLDNIEVSVARSTASSLTYLLTDVRRDFVKVFIWKL